MLSTQEFLILDYELSQTPALRELREGRGTHCVAGVSEIKNWATRPLNAGEEPGFSP